MAGQPGFFDLSDRYEALSAAGDPLERLTTVVDFDVFRGPLVAALRRSVRGKGGRPPFDLVLMFKTLVLQAPYSLSDEATEFQIKDRLSFRIHPARLAITHKWRDLCQSGYRRGFVGRAIRRCLQAVGRTPSRGSRQGGTIVR